MTRKVILDCDPGLDDVLAILLARGCPELDLVAITTVAGNQTLAKVTLNARRACTAAGIRDVPIYAGCDRPLRRELRVASDIHGESGLDGPALGTPEVDAAEGHAVDFLIETLLGSDGDITLVPLGPLTNIATALRLEPRIVTRAREVVLMGGSYTRGNRTPAAEFNMLTDPEAAAAVFEAGWPVTMVGLDLTHQALVPADLPGQLAAGGGAASSLAAALLSTLRDNYRRATGMSQPPLHDPCAVARVVAPELIGVEEAFVAVETAGRWTSGMTVTDFRGQLGQPPNAQVATRLDAPGFWELLVGALRVVDAAAID